ncbi:peroxisomal membrane protein-like protein [Erysiphe pulchra]|uniref:Peroxisomal membrane protein-like protein n=1 Tax=Erysiphe pulchra TaxID=225359 RepID=A0A2S4PU04_9PEZI|nr:peroxisomal membrane protein-like protein [Erysiphe pulchra]
MSCINHIKQNLEEVILNPKNAELLAVLKAARNGAVYGAKVRFPHALVITLLYRSGTLREKLSVILKATRTHATNLATFALIYKLSLLLLKHLSSDPRKDGNYDTFIAGLIGGYLVFGRRSANGRVSSVSKQIVIFVFARVCLSLAQVLVKPAVGIVKDHQLSAKISHDAWPIFAALSWGSVMWLFKWYPETLQTGLRSSMDYIYVQSDHWDSLRNFVIHNK